jgi:uncharacterized sulfatase
MTSTDRPNVVVFFTDQQRWDTIGAYGSPMDVTPHLDTAAENGTVIEHAISSQPVCGPARACLQTGQHATTNGVYTNEGTLRDRTHLIANAFNRAGYNTAYVGKWHLSEVKTEPIPEEQRGGYKDYWRGADVLEFTSHPYEGVLYDQDGRHVEFDGYRVDALTEMAINFIQRDHEDPFFLTLSHLEPHHQNDMGTYVAPEGYAYEHRNPWIPPDLQGTPGDWYEELPDYYGICERLDENYGRLLSALKNQGVLDETIILFLSDHGSHFGTRNAEYKRSCHESSIRIPMILRGPGFESGGRISAPVSLVDVAPTLLEAANIKIPDAMEGDQIQPLIHDEDGREQDVLIQISESEIGRALRTDRWKYSVYAPEADAYEVTFSEEYVERYLYDLAADPYEQTNLICRDEYRSVASDLRDRLQRRIKNIEGRTPDICQARFYA